MASMTARANYIRDMKAQLRELLTRYDPALLWFDGDWFADRHPQTLTDWWNTDDGRDLYNFLIGIKPNLVVNERVKRNTGLGDYACPERTVPARPLPRPWETCQTMNGAWGYDSRKENQYKSVQSLLRELVKAVSRDGNYLLNIGPRGDGAVTSGVGQRADRHGRLDEHLQRQHLRHHRQPVHVRAVLGLLHQEVRQAVRPRLHLARQPPAGDSPR